MYDDRDSTEPDQRTAVERLIARDLTEQEGVGKPLRRRTTQYQRSVEAYLKSGAKPRWMERVGEIDAAIADHRRRLAGAHRALREECGAEPALFARRWRSLARTWSFGTLNELVGQHNEWYPIERNLALNPRTGEYVRVAGRYYTRPVLGPEWILEQFPAAREPDAGAGG